MRRMMTGVLVFTVAFGLYLFFAGTIETVEVVAGLVCASATTILVAGLAIVAIRQFRFAAPSRAIWRPFAALLPETLMVGRELMNVALRGTSRQRGDFVRQPFEPAGDDPLSHGRRAVTVLGISLAPRTFVIRGERGDIMLLHAMPTKPPSSDTTWPA